MPASENSIPDDDRPMLNIAIHHASLERCADGFTIRQPELVRSTLNPNRFLKITKTVVLLRLSQEEARQWIDALIEFAAPHEDTAELLRLEAAEAEV